MIFSGPVVPGDRLVPVGISPSAASRTTPFGVSFVLRRRWRCGVLLWVLGHLWVGLAVRARAADDLAARVIILANSEDPDSVRIARHYAAARNVPAANLIALKLPLTEVIS